MCAVCMRALLLCDVWCDMCVVLLCGVVIAHVTYVLCDMRVLLVCCVLLVLLCMLCVLCGVKCVALLCMLRVLCGVCEMRGVVLHVMCAVWCV